MLAELEARDVLYIQDIDTFGLEDKYLEPLGNVLAWRAAPEFGAASDAGLAQKSVEAIQRIKQMESQRPTYKILSADYF